MSVDKCVEGRTESSDAVTVTYRKPGATHVGILTVDVVLQAIGFAPNAHG